MDLKLVKSIGEHHVAAELARRGWAPALTRDGLERTDLLAVHTEGADRRLVEIQVKTARGTHWDSISWPLGEKCQQPSRHAREYFVLVAVPREDRDPLRCFVVPRSHVAAAAWISHVDWLTDPTAKPGSRNAPVARARVKLPVFARYQNRWDLLFADEPQAPVLLPARYRDLAKSDRVGLPEGHPWRAGLPTWAPPEDYDA